MPLDGRNWKPETETKPDLSKPSLEGLSWLLRHMPETHHWDFAVVGGKKWNDCRSAGCALGLAKAIWNDEYKKCGCAWSILPVTLTTQAKLFAQNAYGVPPESVTPQMVADRIDEFLRSQKADAYLAETRK